MERFKKKKYSVTQMIFVMIQLIISHNKRVSSAWAPARGQHRRSPSGKSKIYIEAFLPLLRPFLGLPLLQIFLLSFMVVSKPEAVTVTKATQIHDASI